MKRSALFAAGLVILLVNGPARAPGGAEESQDPATAGVFVNPPASSQADIGTSLSRGPGSVIVIAARRDSRYLLTSAADGVAFDIDGDGIEEQVAWTEAGSEVAFLARDRNGDGVIGNGKELFGNVTRRDAWNGIDALDKTLQESNGGVVKGKVDSDDSLFAELLLWTDRNHNGASEPSELRPASDGIAAVGLGYSRVSRRDRHSNLFRFRGWVHVRTAPGVNEARSSQENAARARSIYEVFLTTHPTSPTGPSSPW